jgi:inhibitor of cysteine peptidase
MGKWIEQLLFLWRYQGKGEVTKMKKVIILIGTLLIMSLGLLACNTGENSNLDNSLPFTVTFTVSGSYVELSGNNAIYAPKGTYDFNLSIRNDTEEEWKGNCYVFLIDNNCPIIDISDIEINLLNKGGQESTVVSLVLPENIKPGAYGLALLFPGKGYFIKTIYVGDKISGEPAGPWPDISSYKQIKYEASYDDFVVGESSKWIASAHVGDTIVVTLGSNPTTGFKWSDTAQISNPEILKQIDHEFTPPEQTGITGKSGKEVWTFKALKVGTTEISMDYSRPWEGEEKAEWTFVTAITVE